MDLVNQNTEVREKLKEAYMQNKFSINEKRLHSELQQSPKYSIEGRQYLIGEPSGNQTDLPKEDSFEIIGQKHVSKWPIGFVAQTSVLFQRNWVLTGKSQFSILNCTQELCLSIIFGLFWLRMSYNEKTLNDRASFLYFMMIFWPFEI